MGVVVMAEVVAVTILEVAAGLLEVTRFAELIGDSVVDNNILDAVDTFGVEVTTFAELYDFGIDDVSEGIDTVLEVTVFAELQDVGASDISEAINDGLLEVTAFTGLCAVCIADNSEVVNDASTTEYEINAAFDEAMVACESVVSDIVGTTSTENAPIWYMIVVAVESVKE